MIRDRESEQLFYEEAWKTFIREKNGATISIITPELIQQFNADPVFEGPQPTLSRYQYSRLDGAVQLDGKWFTNWIVVDMDQTQRDEVDRRQTEAVRSDRNSKLSASDWTQTLDAPVDQQAWATYRQALRDLPAQIGFPWDITWPVSPS